MIFYRVVYILYDVFFVCFDILIYVSVSEVQVSLRSTGNMQRSLNKQESFRNTIAVGHFVKNTV